ncbi:MAG TPA: hypothetical protein VGJ28_11870 [Micromonosporaceae bacterium]|jgi:hypothetical protein
MTEPLDWSPNTIEPVTPPAIVAVPAAGRSDLRGRRLLIGLPGFGWRGDLRGDSAIVQSSRTYVPVLPEHEWYRAEAEQVEVFAPLVPIDRVWAEIEARTDASGGKPMRDIVDRLVSLDQPPMREPTPVRDAPTVTGKRVVQADGASATRDLRAVTEPYQNTDGDICIRVCTELDWYRWGWSGKPPRTREVPIYLLWVE